MLRDVIAKKKARYKLAADFATPPMMTPSGKIALCPDHAPKFLRHSLENNPGGDVG